MFLDIPHVIIVNSCYIFVVYTQTQTLLEYSKRKLFKFAHTILLAVMKILNIYYRVREQELFKPNMLCNL